MRLMHYLVSRLVVVLQKWLRKHDEHIDVMLLWTIYPSGLLRVADGFDGYRYSLSKEDDGTAFEGSIYGVFLKCGEHPQDVIDVVSGHFASWEEGHAAAQAFQEKVIDDYFKVNPETSDDSSFPISSDKAQLELR